MSYIIILVCVILAGCQSAKPVHTHGMDLSDPERITLERHAANGDATAAWRLYNYYSFERHDSAAAKPWLRLAAQLKFPQAETSLANLIKDYKYSYSGFGETPTDAVRNLLEHAAQTEGDACHDLAAAYAEGYFGSADFSKARLLYARCAGFHYRSCWTELSRYYWLGLGGPKDYSEAYYWIAIETRCVDPRSVGGKESWEKREKIASLISLPELERQWQRVDSFMELVDGKKIRVDFAPFLSGMINSKLEAEGRRLSQEWENEHRQKWRAKQNG